MPNEKFLTSRSQMLSGQTCMRKLYYEYLYRGRGISPRTYPIPLITGIAVHEGLSWLLKAHLKNTAIGWCSNCQAALEWEMSSEPSMSNVGYLCGDCRLPVNAPRNGMGQSSARVTELQCTVAVLAALQSFDQGVSKRQLALDSDEDPGYAYLEQRALVEALVRVYSLVQLPRMIEEYEILEVERDEVWKDFAPGVDFMFKADGLLRHRDTGDLHILSFKTASQYGKLNDDSARYDVQGLSELAGIENRLSIEFHEAQWVDGCVPTSNQGPPRIEAIRMEYLIKGPRLKDNYDGGTKKQNSFLVRPWMKMTNLGENLYSWRWSYTDDMGQEKRLSARDWKRVNIWEHMTIKEWVEKLHNQGVFPNPDFCFESPLEGVVKTPVPYMRQQRDVEDWLEQARAQESRISKAVATIEILDRDNPLALREIQSRLNQDFPQFRQSCAQIYGASCQFVSVCHDGISPDPEDGEFHWREPHHFVEQEKHERLYQIEVER